MTFLYPSCLDVKCPHSPDGKIESCIRRGEMLQTCRDEHGLTNADRKVIFFKVAMLALAVFTLIPAAAFIVAATVPLGLSLLITAAVVTVLAAALTGLLAKGWSDAINERAHLASRTLLTGATT